MPRKPTLSPTRISIYLACPVKYRWTYIDSRGRWLLRSRSYYSFGSTLHKVLQRFHDSEDSGVTSAVEVMAAYEESWIDAGFSSSEEMAEAFGEGRVILERHVSDALAKGDGVRTVHVEKQFRYDMGRFWLVGRLDRVDEYPDGTFEVLDYKSGRKGVSDEDVSTDLAMTIYQFLVARNFPGRAVRARILALRTGISACSSLALDGLDALESDLRLLGERILEEDYYERTPFLKPICGACDFVSLCRKDPVFEG